MTKKFLFNLFLVTELSVYSKPVPVSAATPCTPEEMLKRVKESGRFKFPVIQPAEVKAGDKKRYLQALERQATAAFHQQNYDFAT